MLRFVNIDDEILAKAMEYTGIEDTDELIRDSIRTLVGRKKHSRQMIEKMKNGPKPNIEDYLKSIEKFNAD